MMYGQPARDLKNITPGPNFRPRWHEYCIKLFLAKTDIWN